MNPKVNWLNLSIFCQHTFCHNLLQECLNPVLNLLKTEGKVITALVFLNNDYGENIRISLKGSAEFEEYIFKLVKSSVKNFFKTNYNIKDKQVFVKNKFIKNKFAFNLKKAETKFFKVFSAFDVVKDLYDSIVEEIDERHFKMHTFLSKLILEVCATESINTERKLSFSFYLFFVILRKQGKDIKECNLIIESLLVLLDQERELLRDKDQLHLAYHDLHWNDVFEGNKDSLIEMFNEASHVKTDKNGSDDLISEWGDLISQNIQENPSQDCIISLLAIIFNHFGIEYVYQTLHSFLNTSKKTLNEMAGISSNTNKKNGITVILTFWKRDNLEEQIKCMLQQTCPPDEIWIYHCCEFNKADFLLVKKYPSVKYQYNTNNLGYFGRFNLALLAKTPFIFILDDDVIPTSNWLEKCVELNTSHNAIVSSSGKIIPDNDYTPEKVKNKRNYLRNYFIGESDKVKVKKSIKKSDENIDLGLNKCDCDTFVDFGCNSWFIRKEWLNLFWSIQPYTYETGEDIHLSASCYLKGNIKTICPRQNQQLSGNTKRTYGIDQFASWKENDFINKREKIFRYWIDEKGWKPLIWEDKPALLRNKQKQI